MDVDVTGTQVLIAGYEETVSGDPPYDDAVFVWVAKDDYLIMSYDYTGEPFVNERGMIVTPWSSGGHVGVMRSDQAPWSLWLRGYEGASFNVDLSFENVPYPAFIYERPEGFLIGGNVFDVGKWVSMVDTMGNEQWRKPLSVCGTGVEEAFGDVVLASDRLWGLVGVPTGDDSGEYLVVEFGFDGQLQTSYRIAAPGETSFLSTIASNGEAVVVSGYGVGPGDAFSGWVARLH